MKVRDYVASRAARWGKSPHAHLAALACVLATLAATSPARAGETQPPQPEAPPPERPEYGYWSVGEPRFFVSQKSEVGVPYAKPYVSFGYGLPHWIWTGIDFNAILTTSMVQVYGGVRLASPILDVAFAVRDTWSLDKPFLQRARSYSREDVLDAPGDKARYLALEGEAVLTVPLPYSAFLGDFVLVKTLDVPDDMAVYDESLRVVAADPTFFAMRLAAVVRFMNEDSVRVGVMNEYVFGLGRGDIVSRIGPALSVQLTDHLELNAALTVVLHSPDTLGLVLGAYGVAGVRYRWASGERRPRWPWHEPLIPF